MATGKVVLGAGAMMLGAIGLAWGDFARVWQPVPEWLPGYRALAYASGALLVAAGAGLQLRKTSRLAGLALMVVFGGFALPWAVRVARFPHLFGTWGGLAEQVAVVIAGLILATLAPIHDGDELRSETYFLRAFGLCVVAFGLNHFLALPQTAAMVPSWIPLGGMFWAFATGALYLAAGAAILADILATLAARLLTAMIAAIGGLVWVPVVLTNPRDHIAWAGNAESIVLMGAAWVISDALARRSATFRARISADPVADPGN